MMVRWFQATFTVHGSDTMHACELMAVRHSDAGWWHVCIDPSMPKAGHKSLWIALGMLFDANDMTCHELTEIDRAGNRKSQTYRELFRFGDDGRRWWRGGYNEAMRREHDGE